MKHQAQTLVIPFNGESAVTVVLRERTTGNILSAADGTCTASTTWAAGAIQATQHSVSNDWLVVIPASYIRECILSIYHATKATVTKTTTPDVAPVLFNLGTGRTYTDANPQPRRI
ncbi:MAG: hypothetical protein LLF76_02815 [Planctomycetaceae bacterium]|nr:hypothetical protein [Planctomycetaceae bacterium]